jgi:hypothetical protein
MNRRNADDTASIAVRGGQFPNRHEQARAARAHEPFLIAAVFAADRLAFELLAAAPAQSAARAAR